MYKSLILPIFFAFVSNSFGQKEPPPPLIFGEIKPEEIKMTRYDKDTAAAALVLCSYGRVEESEEIHKRIKIFKKEGFKLAQVEVSHDASEKIVDIEGATYYYEEGKVPVIHYLKQSDIVTDKTQTNFHTTLFSLKNIREGCIIEYKYRIVRSYYAHYSEVWRFQTDIPVLWSEFRFAKSGLRDGYFASLNPVRKYDIHDIIKDKNFNVTTIINRWVQKDLPAIIKEEYAFHFEDYVSKVVVLLIYDIPGTTYYTPISNWQNLGEQLEYSDLFGDFLKKSKISKEIISKILSPSKSEEPKIKASIVYNWVIKNIFWNNKYAFFTRTDKKSFYESRKGHSSEINLFLVTLLREAGLDANPVALSTRSRGALNTEFPVLYQINHTLASVVIDQDTILLDAINKFMPMGMLSEEALNGVGYCINFEKKKFNWTELKNPIKSIISNTITTEIDVSGKITGKFERITKGYNALYQRTGLENKDKDTYTKEKFKDFLAHGTAENIKLENQEDINALLKLSFDYTTTDYIQQSGDLIYLSPLLDFGRTENPFKLKERAYPIDFGYVSDIQNSFTYNIPTGYKIEDLPKTARMQYGEDSSIKYDYLVSQTEGQIKITTKLSIKRTIIPSAGYENIKDFFNKIITKDAEQIVLKKI
jgi:Domain of Unknown Function with PDB structure (DUF3857)/Transglutaminase-like superfamily